MSKTRKLSGLVSDSGPLADGLLSAADIGALALAGGTLTGTVSFAGAQTFPGTQAALVSGTNIKTVNGNSVLGSGDIVIAGGVTSFNTRTGDITLGSSDVTTALGFTPVTQSAVDSSISALVDSAPGTLDTLNELAAALGDDPNFATTVSTSIAARLPLAGGTMTGAVTFAAGQTWPTFNQNTTGNAATATNASQLNSLSKVQMWNNSGQAHSTYQSFGAIPNFGEWFMQNSGAGDSPQSGSQYYVQTVGLGGDYPYGTYGLMTAVARDHATKYTYYRTQENGSWGSWVKAAAGYADSAATATTATNLNGGSINATSASFTGLVTGRPSVGTNVNSNNDTGSFSIRSDSANAASVSFHRTGAYAINMGLGTDNIFRIGGWSAASDCFRMDGSGNLTMLNNVTAYSDERMKRDWAPVVEDFVERFATIKSGTYTRIDGEIRQAGASAQSLQTLLPETVLTDGDGFLSVAYGNAALVAAVELAKRVVSQQARIEKLETIVHKLLENK
jgi:hypothetical protein